MCALHSDFFFRISRLSLLLCYCVTTVFSTTSTSLIHHYSSCASADAHMLTASGTKSMKKRPRIHADISMQPDNIVVSLGLVCSADFGGALCCCPLSRIFFDDGAIVSGGSCRVSCAPRAWSLLSMRSAQKSCGCTPIDADTLDDAIKHRASAAWYALIFIPPLLS